MNLFMRIFLLTLVIPLISFGVLKENVKQQLTATNIVVNAGFEHGRANWTRSGAEFITTTTGAEVGMGYVSGKFDADGSGDYFLQSITIPNALKKKNCAVTFKMKGGDTNLDFDVLTSADAEIVESKTLVSASDWTNVTQNFICPDASSFKIKIISTADAAVAYFDSFVVADAFNINLSTALMEQQIPASLYGSKKWIDVTGCTWETSSGSWTDYSVDASCDNQPRVFEVNAIADASLDGQLPQIRFASLEAGTYEVIIHGQISTYNATSDGSFTSGWRLSDGSTTDVGVWVRGRDTDTPTSMEETISTIRGSFTYTEAQGDTTFKVQTINSSGGVSRVNVESGDFKIFVYHYPEVVTQVSETILSPDISAITWNGNHSTSCEWSTTSTSSVLPTGDATCDLSEVVNLNFGTVTSLADGTGNQPGLSFEPKKLGLYNVCASSTSLNNTIDKRSTVRIYGGPTSSELSLVTLTALDKTGADSALPFTLCSILPVDSLTTHTLQIQIFTQSGGTASIGSEGSPLYWTIFPVTQNFPMPLLVPTFDEVMDYTTIGTVGSTGNYFAGHIWDTDEGGSTDLAYFKFHDSGSLTTDQEGVYTLTNVNAATATDGIMGSGDATELNGTTQYYYNDLLDTTPTAIAIDFWFQMDDGNPSGTEYIFRKENVDNEDQIGFYIISSGQMSVIAEESNNGVITTSSKTLLPDGVTDWIYVCLTWDVTNGIRLWINETLESTDSSATTLMGNGTFQNFDIGADNAANYLDGRISMFRVRDQVLTQKDVFLAHSTRYLLPSKYTSDEFNVHALIQEEGNSFFTSQISWGDREVARDVTNGYFYRYGGIFNATDKLKLWITY